MNRLLLYLNDTLESLDIPPIVKQEPKKIRRTNRKTSKKINLEELK